MKKYKYSCELLLRNRFKKFTGEIEADDKGVAVFKVYDLISEQYHIPYLKAFMQSIKVEEVEEI